MLGAMEHRAVDAVEREDFQATAVLARPPDPHPPDWTADNATALVAVHRRDYFRISTRLRPVARPRRNMSTAVYMYVSGGSGRKGFSRSHSQMGVEIKCQPTAEKEVKGDNYIQMLDCTDALNQGNGGGVPLDDREITGIVICYLRCQTLHGTNRLTSEKGTEGGLNTLNEHCHFMS